MITYTADAAEVVTAVVTVVAAAVAAAGVKDRLRPAPPVVVTGAVVVAVAKPLVPSPPSVVIPRPPVVVVPKPVPRTRPVAAGFETPGPLAKVPKPLA